MGVTYKKLFKLLIDRNMKKKDLRDFGMNWKQYNDETIKR